jgi:type II secretory pathway pseudopilin PulG
MKKIKDQELGFSLIELLVVATIIIVLMAVGMVSYTNAGKGARDGKRKADLETIRQALVLRRSDLGNYPTTADQTTINALGTQGYLSQPYPTDPKNDAASGYVYKYTSTGSGTGFCLCAKMESGGGNNSSATTCNFTGTGFHCLKNP